MDEPFLTDDSIHSVFERLYERYRTDRGRFSGVDLLTALSADAQCPVETTRHPSLASVSLI